MNLGTPVITSNISSLPEASGDAGLLVDPYDVEDISRAMETLFSKPEVRAALIEKGYAHARNFSWEKMAREYLLFLEKTIL
jgi:glycosyltransferase involved in cell wall biosynthesis